MLIQKGSKPPSQRNGSWVCCSNSCDEIQAGKKSIKDNWLKEVQQEQPPIKIDLKRALQKLTEKIIWLKKWSSRRSNLIFANISKRRPAESFNLTVDENKQGVLFHFNFPLGRLLIVMIIVVILRDFLLRGPTDVLSEVHRWKKRDSLLRSIYRESIRNV